MTSRRAAQALVLATALSLLGFKPADEQARPRNRAELARSLDMSVQQVRRILRAEGNEKVAA